MHRYLPLPSIAAVLVTASLRMMSFHYYLGELWKHDKGSFALCIFVAALCVVEDPVIGLVRIRGPLTFQNAEVVAKRCKEYMRHPNSTTQQHHLHDRPVAHDLGKVAKFNINNYIDKKDRWLLEDTQWISIQTENKTDGS
eukprot:g82141.t1